MLKAKTLEDIIREKVFLDKTSNTGWYYLNCPLCGDKRLRGGFKFDAGVTAYSCWNCSSKFKYQDGTGKLSKAARDILSAFGITRDDLMELTSSLFQEKSEEGVTLETLKKLKLDTPEIQFPPRTFPLLSEGHEELQEPILEYMLSRQLDPLKTKFYYSLDPRLLRRVIIPYWRDGKLIYWQARAIDHDVKPRYINCTVAKDAVIYGYDRLHSYDGTPLFITEGVFDAELISGVGILGAKLNPAKIEVLKRSSRRLIFVIDRDKPGGELGKTVLEQGWELTFVDVKAKDINDSILKFGLPYTAYSLIKNATSKQNKLQSAIQLNIGLLEARLRGA